MLAKLKNVEGAKQMGRAYIHVEKVTRFVLEALDVRIDEMFDWQRRAAVTHKQLADASLDEAVKASAKAGGHQQMRAPAEAGAEAGGRQQ